MVKQIVKNEKSLTETHDSSKIGAKGDTALHWIDNTFAEKETLCIVFWI